MLHTYAGELAQPLTQNRYTYTANNPLAYIDPSGHSVVQRVKNGLRNIGNAVVNYGKNVVSTVSSGMQWLSNAITNPGAAIQHVKQTTQPFLNNVQEAIRNAGNKVKQGYSDFGSFATERTEQIRETIKREMCAVTENVWSHVKETSVVFLPVINEFKQLTREGKLDEVISFSIGANKDDNGIYHIRQDYWQSAKWIGYNDFYDFVFTHATDYTGTSTKINKTKLCVNGQNYVIWAWKGDYINLGAGAETGIYQQGIGDYHWFTSTDSAQKMQLVLKNKRTGEEIFSHNPEEKQWWINGFNAQHQNNQADDLISETTIFFSESEQDTAIWNALLDQEYFSEDASGNWSFNFEEKKAVLKW